MIRALLIKLLFRLLGPVDYKDINDERISKWLASQYKSPGYREYFRKRDLQILKTIGTGLEGKKYWIYIGQRLEVMHLLEKIKIAYKRSESKNKGR